MLRTGTPPIACSDPDAGHAGHLADIVGRPWQFPAFEDVVMACLAANPADRPTGKELAAGLT